MLRRIIIGEAIFETKHFPHSCFCARSHSYLIDIIRDTIRTRDYSVIISSSETNERKRPGDRKFHTGSPVFKIPS